jgi:hypothetical protein
MPSCTEDVCDGHRAADALPFQDFLSTSDDGSDASKPAKASYLSGYTSDYTNAEFYTFMSPFNEDLPYMYANFAWTHCDESASSSSSSSSSVAAAASPGPLNSKFVGGLGTGVKARKMQTYSVGSGFSSASFGAPSQE